MFHVMRDFLKYILITKRQTLLISGETARYELIHLIMPFALKELNCIRECFFSVKFSDKILKKVEKLYPTKEDYMGILEGIYRLVETYDLDPIDLMQGELDGIKATPLTGRLHCATRMH